MTVLSEDDPALEQPGAPENREAVAAELAAIAEAKNNRLTPADVVEHARDPRSPLHSHFEWDDGAAAERWRLQQARGLIASVRVTVVERDHQPVENVRAYVSVPAEPRPYYAPISIALSDAETRDAVKRRALSDLRAWQRRYSGLSELSTIFEAIQRVEASEASAMERTYSPPLASAASVPGAA